jgi:glycosyltransferase involved in cell wall biosynthesis
LVGNGNSSYIQHLQSLLLDPSHLHFVDAVLMHKLPPYYSLADLAVWPLQESTSMNDAASMSLPFIANDRLGARLRISNKNALLYKQGNVEDLSKKILWMIQHPVERKKMGKRGRALAVSQLSWRKIAEAYLKG